MWIMGAESRGQQRTLLLTLATLVLLGAQLVSLSQAIGYRRNRFTAAEFGIVPEDGNEDAIKIMGVGKASGRRSSERRAELMAMSKDRLVMQYNLITDVFKCARDFIDNFIKGDWKIPPVCCNLPILSWICQPTRRSPRLRLT